MVCGGGKKTSKLHAVDDYPFPTLLNLFALCQLASITCILACDGTIHTRTNIILPQIKLSLVE